ncbi:hypothetical protein ONS95_013792 [Cadophora gregata]|uniref:uncharacterized protein n=1 Tax=Cadophora gregata TaxID=51156 RepID=UPI0026DD1187|nr:uncharacterized protein ONS95_013792 [Cadophora gregata]KAK0113541.1 hypothetical protein ONS96_014400 [Cadophora gregata f. sp. sojae]KAK0114298.1 hypothetical protein ONS95_013792 [Cadophora gregata]
MSASSSAASSTLTRSRLAVIGFASVATAFTAYWFYRSLVEEEEKGHGSTLHRSNAVHRRRRRAATANDITPTLIDGSGIFVDDAVENDGEGHIVARTLTDGETVVDDQAFAEEYGWTNMPQSYQRNGQNIVQLLFRVSEDATRRNAYVHRGCACNSCNMLPIRGVRYRCANCADYDLCENCESQGLHTKTHIFYKIKVPAISFGPRHIQPVWYSGDPESVMRVLPKEITTKLSRETGFERPELDAYWEQWTFMANTDWRDDPDDINLAMDRRTFERCLVPLGGYRHSAPSLIFDRMFAFYDTNKDDLIGFPEFLHGVAYRKKKDKWRKIFDGYDIDADGYVDRKDFLRMFRSYYVLHRQIHRDMIEGAEEQQMSSTEAHRLISGRQPLSSAFGQDGRYPRAPDPRTGEGKSARVNGDLQIIDGKGIMNESSNDTGNREDVFKRDVPRSYRSHWHGDGDRTGAGYWETIINPPQTVEQMPAVLRHLQRIRGQVAEALGDEPDLESENFPLDPLREQPSGDDDEGNNSDSSLSNPEADRNWPPSFVRVTDEDAEAIDGPGTTVENVRKESRRAVIQQAMFRKQTQEDVHDRWQRRQFYTDEEEGAIPPANWKDEDDILAQSGMAGESSKAPSRPTIHSRSSSRVRFAEDMDDFDTQSNISNSSRSVPERWGGMEIPDAERDAGKEILYQVTQQAFNELLDPLFKDKEDMAIEAASTKAEREKWGYLYMTPEFEKWAQEKEAQDAKPRQSKTITLPNPLARPPPPSSNREWPQFREVEIEQVRERPLEELLAATGYEVDESLARQDDDDHGSVSDFASIPDTTPPNTQRSNLEAPASDSASVSNPRPQQAQSSPTSTELLSVVAEYGDGQDTHTSPSTPPRSTPPESETSSLSYRDPTLPQFRPDAEIPYDPTSARRPTTDFIPLLKEEHEARQQRSQEDNAADADILDMDLSPPAALNGSASAPTSAQEFMKTGKKPRKETLFQLWKIERAVKEAEENGGWGRLGFADFERRVKRAVGEGKGSQMDYLGSWIDFCIP